MADFLETVEAEAFWCLFLAASVVRDFASRRRFRVQVRQAGRRLRRNPDEAPF